MIDAIPLKDGAHLTPREHELLALLLRAHWLSSHDLHDRLWGGVGSLNNLRELVKRLRLKLAQPDRLRTLHGGYALRS